MERYGEFGPYREMEVELEYDNNGAKLVSNMSDTKKDKIEEKRKLNSNKIRIDSNMTLKSSIKYKNI